MNKNKYTLGIYNSNTAGACLFRDGELIYAASEERFTRKKQQNGMPNNVLISLEKYTGVQLCYVEDVAYGGYNNPSIEAIKDYLNFYQSTKHPKVAERIENSLRVDSEHVRNFCMEIRAKTPNAKVHFVDHHESHAYAAYAFASKTKINILTADGRGDLQSTVIWVANGDSPKRVKTFCEFKSLGFFYGQITKALGFVPYRHEGKVTGLAAMGNHTDLVDIFNKYIYFECGDIKLSDKYQPFNNPEDMNFLNSAIKKFSKENVAYAAQAVLEKVVLSIIRYYCNQNLPLAVAGGIFGNVKLNQRIRESGLVKSLYVFPEMSDGGLCVGAAASVISAKRKEEVFQSADGSTCTFFSIKNMYLGNEAEWNNLDLDGLGIEKKKYLTKENFINDIVLALIANKIIGLVIGRMEFGPRALGGRSIIFQATGTVSPDHVNKRFERSEFMPFAPVTLSSKAKDMYLNYHLSDVNTNFMTTCYSCTAEMMRISPVVVHIDNTARPQIIDESIQNKIYFDILNEYFVKTGVPTLVNTSFNRHEEPIVCSSFDALRALSDGMVDLVVNDKNELYFRKNENNF